MRRSATRAAAGETEMDKLAKPIGSVPVLGGLLAGAVDTWMALADASNIMGSRWDGSGLADQNAAIERVLAKRAMRANADPVAVDMQAAA